VDADIDSLPHQVMQNLTAAAAAVQAAHGRLQANPLPALLMQRVGNIPPLQGVRMPDCAQQQQHPPHSHYNQLNQLPQIQHQSHAKTSGDHGIGVTQHATVQENDGQIQAPSAAMPAATSDPIMIPLMRRVASVIECLKTQISSSDTPANSPVAAAIFRLEHALVSFLSIFCLKSITSAL
jgi:hypothetical protein